MTPYDEVFVRLQAGDETRKIARSLHRQASLLTKQGSGRTLGQGHSALSAICAFLASTRLGNGEVTRDQACAVACVDPKTFDSTLSIVESVLRATPSSPRLTQLSITYQSLLKRFGAREDAFVPMLEVEETLRGCGSLVDGSPIDLKSPLMKCAIFYWVCTVVLGVTIPDAHLRQMIKASPYKWSASQRVLEKHCSSMVEDLTRKAETATSGRETRSQMQSRTKVKDHSPMANLQPRELSDPSTPTNSALVQRMKRKMPDEVESKESGSPSKRPKRPTYVPSGLGQDLSTHTPKARRVNAAAARCAKPGAMHEEESDNESASNETIVVRPTRPTRNQFSRSAWDLQKPIPAAVGSEPVTPTSTRVSPSAAVVAFDNTPMTSTGRSDTSSPTSLSPTRAGVRAFVHIPSTAKELSYSIHEDEEMPRRRRRNLRAAFLNPGIYGWKPAACTSKKLERARKWESLMVGKYGDPWDAW
ncbi:hypothetical protein JB92DRAFT_3147850 [Gautieria morchelliformis]|nr:hypothetical protein JB92DRAFT_3147850 [Gautieria morchelliformis]